MNLISARNVSAHRSWSDWCVCELPEHYLFVYLNCCVFVEPGLRSGLLTASLNEQTTKWYSVYFRGEAGSRLATRKIQNPKFHYRVHQMCPEPDESACLYGQFQYCPGISGTFTTTFSCAIVDSDVACASAAFSTAGSSLSDVTVRHNHCYSLHCAHLIKQYEAGRYAIGRQLQPAGLGNTSVMFDTSCMFGLHSSSHHPTRVSKV
jgi:hypothetical protein